MRRFERFHRIASHHRLILALSDLMLPDPKAVAKRHLGLRTFVRGHFRIAGRAAHRESSGGAQTIPGIASATGGLVEGAERAAPMLSVDIRRTNQRPAQATNVNNSNAAFDASLFFEPLGAACSELASSTRDGSARFALAGFPARCGFTPR